MEDLEKLKAALQNNNFNTYSDMKDEMNSPLDPNAGQSAMDQLKLTDPEQMSDFQQMLREKLMQMAARKGAR